MHKKAFQIRQTLRRNKLGRRFTDERGLTCQLKEKKPNIMDGCNVRPFFLMNFKGF